MIDSITQKKFLARSAKEVKNYAVTRKILLTALAGLLTLVMILYIIAVLYKKTGSFTVSLNKYQMTEYGLTLSETSDMKYKTSYLNAEIDEDITNIAEETLPDDLDMIDGEHNGINYVAYTFYLQNAGRYEVSYDYQVQISNITNNLDSAIRIRLYVDGVETTYAKTRSDGTGPEEGTKEFYSSTVAAIGRIDNFKPLDQTKYTIVIWIEGNDPDCIDELIGGTMKVDMSFNIIH